MPQDEAFVGPEGADSLRVWDGADSTAPREGRRASFALRWTTAALPRGDFSCRGVRGVRGAMRLPTNRGQRQELRRKREELGEAVEGRLQGPRGM